MSAIHAQGVQPKRCNGAGTEVFTLVGQITDFKGPSPSSTVIDTTTLDSTAKEKLIGLTDGGTCTFTINYAPQDTQHQGVISDMTAKTLRNWKLVLTDADDSEIAFSAYVNGFEISGTVDAVVTASVSLEISGEITWPA